MHSKSFIHTTLQRMVGILLLVALYSVSQPAFAGPPRKTENVVLVTVDGLRWQEIFGGCDESLLNKDGGGVSDVPALKAKYWRETPEERRETLMPFFWKSIARDGQVFGDATRKASARVTNGMNFSYPGYSEILCGFSDPRIDSNDKKNNPNVTLLEWLNQKPAYKGKVAAFTSWDVFPWIINSERSGIPVNAGWQPIDPAVELARAKALGDVSQDLPRLWENVRYDTLTYQATIDHLQKHRPRLLYVSLGETDDFAHMGRYDQYLGSAHSNDRIIEKLWKHLQSLPEYAGKTSLVLTTDHGRGDDRVAWKSHGRDMAVSQFMW
ncbi:MAG: alkaline phosphatase family protein, partial [Planctomycetota bacterium]|nr:alkaline phosphatase family protein [Planctomycetota bacterium]